jgi:3-oxoacyl-[acyl-carrier protein] reductase
LNDKSKKRKKLMSSRSLVGKVAVVTGSSRGIGAAIASRLAHEGASVVLHYGANREKADTLARAITAEGGQASVVQADLSRPDGADQLASAISAPRIDILVNNAGIAPYVPFSETSPATFDEVMNVNVRAVFFLTQKLLPRIPDGGRIINISTAVTRTYFPAGITAYAASKGFVDVLTLYLAGELGARNITVNTVAPGAIDTDMSAWVRDPNGVATLKQIQALPGVGQPRDIAGVVAFLAGPDGRWTTGAVIDASGGTKL